jgi:hypothetical protein
MTTPPPIPPEKPIANYVEWLDQCWNIAMRSEWEIDYGFPKWTQWFEDKLSPELAVQRFFAYVKDNTPTPMPMNPPEKPIAATKHELKTWPEFFQVAWAGDKPFEIRYNDRGFKERDEIVLQEFTPDPVHGGGDYSGREIHGFIDYVTSFEQQNGFVVFSYRQTHRIDV